MTWDLAWRWVPVLAWVRAPRQATLDGLELGVGIAEKELLIVHARQLARRAFAGEAEGLAGVGGRGEAEHRVERGGDLQSGVGMLEDLLLVEVVHELWLGALCLASFWSK